MSRLVQHKVVNERTSAAAPPTDTGGESYAERAAKYVPAEIVAGYAGISSLLDAVDKADPLRGPLMWAAFGLGLVVTPLYLAKMGQPRGQQWIQVGISTVAFAVWAYTLGGPFAGLPWYRAWLGGLIVAVYTFLAGLFQPTEPAQTSPVAVPAQA